MRYQIYNDGAGVYRFALRGANDKVLVMSEAYRTKAGCRNSILSIQKNCHSHVEDITIEMDRLSLPKYTVYVDRYLQFRFRLSAPNGEIIVESDAYETKSECMNGISAMIKSCNSPIEELLET